MSFTAGELTNIANSMLDYYLNKGSTFKQTIQDKPLLAVFEGKSKQFPGGKGDISLGIVGAFGAAGVNDTLRGYTHDDTVNFYTPANNLRAAFPWREHHIGLTLTHTELKINGMSVTDTDGNGTSNHSDRDMSILVDLMESKLFDFGEQYARSTNSLLWGDGTGDAKALAGVRAAIVPNPTTGTYGGLSRATNTWWRNRARTAAHLAAGGQGAVTSSATNGGALVQILQQDFRQLRRFGGKPDQFFCGSDFLSAMEVEMRANGYYTQSGFRGAQDPAMGGMKFDGITVTYDPTLDDLGFAKRAYIWDSRDLTLMKMQNEWKRQHTPRRPANQFVLYRSVTCTGQVVASRLNSSMVIDIV
jgi:hypothetical protein